MICQFIIIICSLILCFQHSFAEEEKLSIQDGFETCFDWVVEDKEFNYENFAIIISDNKSYLADKEEGKITSLLHKHQNLYVSTTYKEHKEIKQKKCVLLFGSLFENLLHNGLNEIPFDLSLKRELSTKSIKKYLISLEKILNREHPWLIKKETGMVFFTPVSESLKNYIGCKGKKLVSIILRIDHDDSHPNEFYEISIASKYDSKTCSN